MKTRMLLCSAIALAGVTLTASPARAIGVPQTQCLFTQHLGIGGFLTGCLAGTASQIGEDAGLISTMYYFSGGVPTMTNTANWLNAPNPAGTVMFNDNCGSNGSGGFFFCTSPLSGSFNNVASGNELVFGLQVPDGSYGTLGYWDYTGAAARNGSPAPVGFQAVLLAVTVGGVQQPGQYVLAWEDKNSGCGGAIPNPTTIEASRLVANAANQQGSNVAGSNQAFLDTRLANCNPIASGGNSDSDFNDFYVRLTISQGTLEQNPVPEPMTMSLMALGLVAMGGASWRRRKNSK